MPEDSHTIRDRHLLIVEDEERQRAMLEQAANEFGYNAISAPSGEDAMELLPQLEHVQLVLVDLNLPGMSGIEFLERLHPLRPRAQAIVLTGYGDLDAAQRAIRIEVVDFLTKPCPLAELEAALERAWERYLTATGLTVIEARRIRDVEREMITAALERHGNHRAEAARELGISLRTLYYRLSQYEAEDRIMGRDESDPQR